MINQPWLPLGPDPPLQRPHDRRLVGNTPSAVCGLMRSASIQRGNTRRRRFSSRSASASC